MASEKGDAGRAMDPTLGAFVRLQAMMHEQQETAREQKQAVREAAAATAKSLEQVLAKLDGLASRPAGGGAAGAIPPELENLGYRLDAQTQGMETMGETLAGYIHSGRARQAQNRLLWLTGAACVLVGIVIGGAALLWGARTLPYGFDTRLAAMVVGKARWAAADDMKADADYTRWFLTWAAAEMAKRNSDRLEPCIEAAIDSGAAEPCRIEVLAPAQYYQDVWGHMPPRPAGG